MRTQRNHLADRAPGLAGLPAADLRRVLHAATEVFVAEGYHATTKERLQLQIYPRIFDSLFVDEEDCFLQVFDHLTISAGEQIAASAAIEEPWPRRLAAALGTLLGLIDAQPTSARLVFVDAQIATPAITRRFYETLNSIAPFMREGRARCDSTMPAVVDSVLPGGIAVAIAEHLKAGREAPVNSLYDELLQVLLDYYLDKPEVEFILATQTWGRRYEFGAAA